jgi:fluoroquinolone transport system permease protein
MKAFVIQLWWQMLLLHKNNIIVISLVVTLVYGGILYALKDLQYIDELVVALVLNDPAVIGYFFMALAIFTEIKHGVLAAILVSPQSIHRLLITKIVALSIVGTICSLGLAISIKGIEFGIFNFTVGTFWICVISILVGIIILSYADDFLDFALKSIPIFLALTGLPLLHYLQVIDFSAIFWLFPIQGCLDLITTAFDFSPVSYWYSFASILVVVSIFYLLAIRRFHHKIKLL